MKGIRDIVLLIILLINNIKKINFSKFKKEYKLNLDNKIKYIV